MTRFAPTNLGAYEIRDSAPPVGPDEQDEADLEDQLERSTEKNSAFRRDPLAAFLDDRPDSELTSDQRRERRLLPVEQVAPFHMTFIEGRPYFDLIHALSCVAGWDIQTMLRHDWRNAFDQAAMVSTRQLKHFGRVWWEATQTGWHVPWVTYQQFEMFMKTREGYTEEGTQEVIDDVRAGFNNTVRIVTASEKIFSVMLESGKGKMTATEIWRKCQSLPGDVRKHALEYLVARGRMTHVTARTGGPGAPSEIYELAWV